MVEIVTIEDEILAENLKSSQEERRANGRMIALIIAVSLIFLAIYHAMIRKTPVLAGALVSALIMILYGGWVIFLAKRDKKRRFLLEQRMGEKMSEKGSEYGAPENFISATAIKGPKSIESNGAKSSVPTAAATPKKKRRIKNTALDKPGGNPSTNPSAAIHKSNGRKKQKQKRHTPAEIISKLRQDRVPLCRTCSAP